MIKGKNIFSNGKNLSAVAFGTHKFGLPETDEKMAFALLDRFMELGGNIIDTARCYAAGEGEKVIGRWLKQSGARDKAVICTKGGEPEYIGDGARTRLNEKELKYDFEKTFEALDTEYADIYFLHKDDENIPVDEIMDIIAELAKEGRVKHFGASNWTNERIAKANAYAEKKGTPKFEFSEMSFSLKHRVTKGWGERALVLEMDKNEFFEYERSGIPLFGYNSQGYGFFDVNAGKPLCEVDDSETNKKLLDKVNEICKKEGMSPSEVLFGFYNSCGITNIPLVTTSSLSRLDGIAKSCSATLAEEYVKELFALRFSE